jgi:hypothetical protein
MTLSGSKPSGTLFSRTRLLTMRPAPTSSNADNAIWASISAVRQRMTDAPAMTRPEPLSASTGRECKVCHAGMMPKTRPVTTATTAV